MRLLRVRLKNFCQIRDLEFELSPGLNAIVGANGRGKSNCLKAAYAALTNDFGRNPGTKGENVCQLAGPRDQAEVEVTFEHRGATYGLTRVLSRDGDSRPARQTLLVPGEPPVTRDAAVTARVQQVLGVTPDILDKYVFVDQWAMFDFLTATPAERAKAFARLFGTHEAEAAWKAASEQALRVKVPQVAADLDEQRGRLAEAEATLAALRDRAAAYAHLPAAPDVTEDDLALQDARRRAQLDADELAQEARLEAAGARLGRLRREREAFEADLATLRPALGGSAAAADAAKAAIANWRTLQQVGQARDRAAHRLEALRGEEALHRRPVRNGLYLEPGARQQAQYDADNVAAQVRAAKGLLRSFDPATGVAACPTCFTPAATIAPTVEAARRDLPGLEDRLKHLQAALLYTREHEQEAADYVRWRQGWEAQVADLERQLATLQSVPRPDRTEAELSQVVAQHADLEAAVRDVTQELARVAQEEAGHRAQAHVAEEALAAIRAERGALRLVSPEDLPEIERRIADRLRAFHDRARVRGELDAQGRLVAGLRQAVARLEADAAEAARARATAEHLAAVATVLHRDNLPRAVARDHLRGLTAETNRMLDAFMAPFRAAVEDDLSFTAHFHDGRTQAAGRLSGAEKVVLALAFRLSVNSTFAQDVGLLCLDEPTVGLDEHNLGCLRTALERLRDLSGARGLQVVLVTHERSLMTLFDKVIDLDAGA